jgi:ABC-type anion transport system duplicated permease subunit
MDNIEKSLTFFFMKRQRRNEIPAILGNSIPGMLSIECGPWNGQGVAGGFFTDTCTKRRDGSHQLVSPCLF